MTAVLIAWVVACVAGLVLSLQSARVLRRRSSWTIAGWLVTAFYFGTAALAAIRARPAPAHLDYVSLALLTVAFVVAGLRDEPQAEPWWWPSAAGWTGRERRARRAQDDRDRPL